MTTRRSLHLKPIHIFEDMYGVNFYISYGVPYDTHKRAVKKYIDIEIGESHGDGKVSGFQKDGEILYWIWTSSKNKALLVHEITHAVICCLKDRGFTCSTDSDEAYAYLAQYLFRKITSFRR